ncbi:MAG: hypothetical protein KME13_12490 [Myxacorys californica WJT36-NPBG1]|jgi:uncharacterized membrane protein|nr:hypothetical protein [Myxacorys californica WJT36-NPBG1]
MDELVSKIAGLGVAGLVLVIVMGFTGFAGAAALTTALAALGGPFGMLGGLAILGILTTLSSAIAKYGVDEIAKSVVQQMLKEGRTRASIIKEINAFPLITDDLRAKLRDFVQHA